MKLTKNTKSYRVVTTPTRTRINIPMLLHGLQVSDDPEIIDNTFLSSIDGMIYYSGLFRTDWESQSYTEVDPIVDNISTVAAASVPECAS